MLCLLRLSFAQPKTAGLFYLRFQLNSAYKLPKKAVVLKKKQFVSTVSTQTIACRLATTES